MDLWGVEIKPGAPYVLQLDKTRGKLHISQATLGVGSSSKVSLLQGVAVSGGPQSVHLDGYYLGSTFAHGDGDERNVEINADEHTNG
ncbi:hypothetical protein FRX31_011123 [Thalictrum thalictroides]|uniref:Nucleoplasmin-like domain-containing protein n=1 Tax=Thalictrum thalictroides TaxID=46969 RepID=A0A7J6WPJ1_THATH|nr:hypothetical protein FRX31_011123 [Thalictrum thalictroides]